MSALYLFIAIIVVLSISIILAIANWIFQARISSRIGSLEEELEKKNLEFDAFKKERASAQTAAKAAPTLEMSPQLDMPMSQQTVDDGAIQIVRNIRGTFQPADAHADRPGNESAAAQTKAWPPQEPQLRPSEEQGAIGDTEHWPPAGHATTPAAVAPSYSAPAAPPSSPEPGAVISLFSPALRGADFDFLYKAIIDILKTRPADRVIGVDFASVVSLRDQDLDYLEKIYWSLKGQNRSLVFLHCSRTIATLAERHPPLASLIR